MRPRTSVFAIALGGALSLNIGAYMKGYLPLDEKELSHRFPLHVIRGKFTQDMDALRIGSTTVRFEESANDIRFAGRDNSGKPWTVTAGAWRGGALYSGDLDHNGTTDLIYASYTGSVGLAPSMRMLTLLFDGSGRPVPAEMYGYFEIDSRGIEDLLDLDGSGHAQLVRQGYDDGYWITSLYEATDARWQLVHGRHAGREYPMFTRYTYRSNRVPVTPPPNRHPLEDDFSYDLGAGTSVTITRLNEGNEQPLPNPTIQLSDDRACAGLDWFSTTTVVLDTPERRVAAVLDAPEEGKRLLEAIARKAIPIRLSGNRHRNDDDAARRDQCLPEMIWAQVR